MTPSVLSALFKLGANDPCKILGEGHFSIIFEDILEVKVLLRN